MSFIDDSEKNVNRLIETSAAGGVAGFVGKAGRDIDALFAGPFHPDSGHGSENEKLLQKQLDDRKEMRSDMETNAAEDGVELVGNPSPVGGYFAEIGEVEAFTLAFDELARFDEINRDFNAKVTPPQDLEWVEVKTDIKYDEPGEAYRDRTLKYDEYGDSHRDTSIKYDTEEGTLYKARTLKYDDVPEYAGDNFINTSEKNWQYIDREER